jgi:hypothetical protein
LAFHLGREADHSLPSSTDLKEWVELYLHSPNTPSWRGLKKPGNECVTIKPTESNIPKIFEILHGDEDSGWVLMDCDAV